MLKDGAVTRVESNVYYLDSRKVGAHGVSGVYLLVADGVTLIETGTSLTAPAILEAVQEMGIPEDDIKRAIVTHIHLDHSGAAGWLVKRLPHLTVYVHERGARHLEDPSRLIESASMVYGGMDRILAMHGDILPVPAENLAPITDTEIDIGDNIRLKTFDAPGHASHHLGIYDEGSGCLFAGEALGHYQPERDELTPAVAPPGFSYEDSLATIEKIKDLNARTVCFSQFGFSRDPATVIQTAEEQIRMYYDLTGKMFEDGLSANEVIKEIANNYLEFGPDQEISPGSNLQSIVLGYQVYFQRREATK
ncbi:MAG: MBL fold metallo-hydrolase [Deltaproteobacteria bacterium]|nr:MBL fold metallo-hydrolase [Deltaproteobacteria bacterium]